MMKMTADKTLRSATRNLTGKRETDIAFLKAQIESRKYDARTCAELKRILRCLIIPTAGIAAA